MRHMIAGLLLVLCASAAMADPASDALKAKFSEQEQILLAGVLADPSQAAEFAKDAQSGADVKLKWFSRISSFSQDYLNRPHGFNDKATQVKDVGEPSEWAMLMTTLRKMQNGGILQQAKMKVFIGMIDDANDSLKRGDASGARNVVDMGRKNLVDALKEYLGSPDGKAGASEADRLRKQDEKRKQDDLAKQKQDEADRQKQAELDKQKQAELEKQKKNVPPKPEPKKPEPASVAKPTPNPSKAIDEAEKARQEAEAAARAGTPGGSQTYENGAAPSNGASVVVAPGQNSGARLAPSNGLSPAKPGASQPSLIANEPPAPGDDMAELHQMKEKVKGHKTLYATIGGGVLGAGLGFLIGALLGGPIVGLLVGAAMAAAGAYAGNAVGKKLWG